MAVCPPLSRRRTIVPAARKKLDFLVDSASRFRKEGEVTRIHRWIFIVYMLIRPDLTMIVAVNSTGN